MPKFTDSHYCRISKIALSMLGLWPKQRPLEQKLRAGFLSVCLGIAITTQVLKILQAFNDFDLLVEVVALTTVMVVVATKVYTFYKNRDLLQYLLNEADINYTILRDNREFEIMETNMKIGKFHASVYTVYIYTTLVLFIGLSFEPYVLNVVQPLNESRPRRLIYPAEYYFLNEEDHFSLITCHMIFACCLTATVMIAVDSMYIIYVRCGCSLFSIVGYRFGCSIYQDDIIDEFAVKSELGKFNRMEIAVPIHNQAIKYIQHVESVFAMPCLIQVGVTVLCLIFSLMETLILLGKFQMIRFVFFAGGSLIHLFGFCYQGQLVIDETYKTADTIYNGPWHTAPKEIQNALLFVLKRFSRLPYMTAGKVLRLSIENYSTENPLVLETIDRAWLKSHETNILKLPEDFFDNSYYKTVKRHLYVVGQYPYQSRFSSKFFMAINLCSTWSLIIPQIIKLSQSIRDRDFDHIIMSITPMMVNSICFVKMFNLFFNREKFRRMLDLIEEDWKILKDKEELQVLMRFTAVAVRLNHLYRIYIYATMGMYASVPLAPIFLNILLSPNESYPRNQLYEVDYLVDSDKYFYPLYFHSVYSSLCTIVILVSFDTLYISITYHVGAVFALCGHRLMKIPEYAMTSDLVEGEEREKFLVQKLREAISTHKRAIEFADLLESSSRTSYLLQVSMSMINVSITGLQTVIKLHELHECARFATFTIAQSFHLYVMSTPGQFLLDYSSDLLNSVYSARWYMLPAKLQKFYFVMQIRCRVPCKLTAGGLTDMNVENFSKVMKTSVSYFTMFLSLRE